MAHRKRKGALPLKTFVEFMIAHDEPGLVEAVQEAVVEVATRRGFSRDEFLDAHKIRRTYFDAIELSEKWVKRPDKLIECLSELQIPLESLVSTDFRLPPWDAFRSGSTVVIVVGEKFYRDTDSLKNQAVGVHDIQAVIELIKLLNEKLQLRFKVEVYQIPLNSSPEEAEDDLERLRSRYDVGLIITIGAPVVNSMVEPLAKTIFTRASIEAPPARFRWSFDLRRDPNLQLPETLFLSEPAPGPEGILARGGFFLPRVCKREVVDAVRRGDYGPFADAGMLLMDFSCEPYLIAAAGHSGLSTIAACKAISRVDDIFEYLERSKTPGAPLGANRILALIEVYRRKPKDSDPRSNDLFFNPTYGSGWRFAEWDFDEFGR